MFTVDERSGSRVGGNEMALGYCALGLSKINAAYRSEMIVRSLVSA
jgi:hypothetical protein